MYGRLDDIMGILEKSFNNDAEKAKKKFGDFREWERNALDFINILEGDDLEQKLVVLNYETSRSRADPIDEGYRIIDEAQRNKD